MKFSVSQVSRKGGREKNEDRVGYCYTKESALFLLADGMGGHPEGEVAAQIALHVVAALYKKNANPIIVDAKQFLQAATMAAHRQILHYALHRGMADTPRTTLVAAIVQRGVATWVHCGDSRLYLVRSGQILLRTRDHSYLEQHASGGPLPQFSGSLNRNVLYTCLGSPVKPVFDISEPLPLVQGDKILLCSDGLWDSLDDVEIATCLIQKPVADAAHDLVESALFKGGTNCDNVSLIALEWEPPDVFESAIDAISTGAMQEGAFASTIQGSLDALLQENAIDASVKGSAPK